MAPSAFDKWPFDLWLCIPFSWERAYFLGFEKASLYVQEVRWLLLLHIKMQDEKVEATTHSLPSDLHHLFDVHANGLYRPCDVGKTLKWN